MFQVRGVDYALDEGVGEEDEKMLESDNFQETNKQNLTEDNQKEGKEEEETTSEEQIIERGRKRLKSPS